jgi:hypothetical protein
MRASTRTPNHQTANAGSSTDRQGTLTGEVTFTEFRELMLRQLIIEETEEDIRYDSIFIFFWFSVDANF